MPLLAVLVGWIVGGGRRGEALVVRLDGRALERHGRRLLHDRHRAAGHPLTHFGLRLVAAQQRIDGVGNVGVDRESIAVVDLDEHVERRRRLAFEHRLARAAAARFFVGERDAADAADQVGERRVHQDVFERSAVRGADELHAAFRDGTRGQSLGFGPDLVDDDDFGHVIFHGLDHDRVLVRGIGDLHAPGMSDTGMRDVAVARDLVGRVDDHDALAVFGEHARALAQHRRLAHARRPEQTDRLTAAHDVEDDVDRAVDRAPHATGQADDLTRAIANRRDAMQRLLDAGAIARAEG